MVTNSFDAEYGRTGNWFTSVSIRSGTNPLHGSAFDDFANDKLDARSFFQAQRQRVRQNEAGFTLGGPGLSPQSVRRPQPYLLLLRRGPVLDAPVGQRRAADHPYAGISAAATSATCATRPAW